MEGCYEYTERKRGGSTAWGLARSNLPLFVNKLPCDIQACCCERGYEHVGLLKKWLISWAVVQLSASECLCQMKMVISRQQLAFCLLHVQGHYFIQQNIFFSNKIRTLCVAYLTTLWVADNADLCHQIEGWILNDLERLWKETVLHCSCCYPAIYKGELRKTAKAVLWVFKPGTFQTHSGIYCLLFEKPAMRWDFRFSLRWR